MKVADGYGKGSLMLPNGKYDTDIQQIGMTVLAGNSARMENGPSGAANTNAEAYRAPSETRTEDEVPTILPILDGLTDAERRELLIGKLDEVRRAYESARNDRLQLMVLARDNGMSCHEIAILLGRTENAIRAQIRRTRAEGSR